MFWPMLLIFVKYRTFTKSTCNMGVVKEHYDQAVKIMKRNRRSYLFYLLSELSLHSLVFGDITFCKMISN